MAPWGSPEPTPSHWHTESTAACRSISSLKNLKAGWVMTTHEENEKKSYMQQVAGTQSHQKPLHWLGAPQVGGTQSPEEEWRGWSPHEAPQILRPTPDRQAPKMSTFENQLGSCPETHKNVVIWETTLKRHAHSDSPTPGLSSERPVVHWQKMKWDHIRLKTSAQPRKQQNEKAMYSMGENTCKS